MRGKPPSTLLVCFNQYITSFFSDFTEIFMKS
jgi:hypothetical protein